MFSSFIVNAWLGLMHQALQVAIGNTMSLDWTASPRMVLAARYSLPYCTCKTFKRRIFSTWQLVLQYDIEQMGLGWNFFFILLVAVV